jgi:hypothetical protein
MMPNFRLTEGVCEVCSHPASRLINQMIANGQPDQMIQDLYPFPEQTLYTHRWQHVPLSMASAMADPQGLLVQAQIALQKVQFWEDLCEGEGLKKAAMGLKAAEIRLKHIQIIQSLMAEEAKHKIAHDWERIKRVLIQVFAKFPEARIEFEHLLREAGESVTVVEKS